MVVATSAITTAATRDRIGLVERGAAMILKGVSSERADHITKYGEDSPV